MAENNFDINDITISCTSCSKYPLKNYRYYKKNKDITFNEMQNICSSGKCSLCKSMPEDNKRCIFLEPYDDELDREFELDENIIEDWSTVIKEEIKEQPERSRL